MARKTTKRSTAGAIKSSLRKSNILDSSGNSFRPIDCDDSDIPTRENAPSQPTKTGQKTITHRFLFGFSALYILLFGGAFWGWGPMQLMLQEHGSYTSLCDEGVDMTNALSTEEPCPAQSARLLNV